MERAAANFGATPRVGERILVLREDWLELILAGHKDLEIRGMRLREGDVWLGCRSTILGKARLGPAVTIGTEQEWAALRWALAPATANKDVPASANRSLAEIGTLVSKRAW